MFTSALVALDLSPAEEPILDCLSDLITWGIKKLTLTHVIPVGYNKFAGYGHEDDYRNWLQKRVASLRDTGIEVDIAVRSSGAVAEEILSTAAEVKADLVVIGSRGQSRVRGLFLGSVAREVIRQTSLPILLEWLEPSADETRERCEAVCKHTLDHILLATDHSRHAGGAEKAAITLAARAQQTELLTVITPDALGKTPRLPIMVEAALGDIQSHLLPEARQVRLLTETGKPCDAIARIATEGHCSLIIVGKHGQGWLESKVIGSTAARLCETAKRPVLIVPVEE